MQEQVFKRMADSWKSEIVSRVEVAKFSGGVLSARYLANLDSLGQGVPGRFAIGRKVCYPKRELIQWMKSRATKEAL